ncbi:aldo/keto reductase [Streptomyces cellulosae]
MTVLPLHKLNDGTQVPAVGFGTWPLSDDEAEEAVIRALQTGYRLVDTAAAYGNERGVGQGIIRSGVPREEIVVTTKLRGRDHGYEETLAAFEESRKQLGLDHVDLYLIHWPLPRVDRYVDSWRAFIHLQEQGLVHSIGVSNFTSAQLARLEEETGVLPAVNQVEMHPYLTQDGLRAFHAVKHILTEAWSPLGRGTGLLQEPDIMTVAERHAVTPAQVVLRWHTQLGSVPIPKSTHPERQKQNLNIFGFTLTEAELDRISHRSQRRLGGDPDTHEEF